MALERAQEELERLLRSAKTREKTFQLRIERGHLVIYRKESPPDTEPQWVRAIRLTPLGGDRYGLSVYGPGQRWEKTPFCDDLRGLAKVMTTHLAHFLADPW